MSDYNMGAGMTKADLILFKLEKMAQQNTSLEARLNALIKNVPAGQSADIGKLSAENAALKQEIRYLSLQVESIYDALERSLKQIADEVAALKGGVPVAEGAPAAAPDFNVDDLASRVAAKIVIPEVAPQEIDTDAIAQKVVEKLPSEEVALSDETTMPSDFDYDAIGIAVAKNIHIPQAIAEDIDYEELAQRLSEKLNLAPAAAEGVAPAMDYDAIGLSVAKNIYIPQAIAEDIDYEELSAKVAEKLDLDTVTVVPASAETAVADKLDYDVLAEKVAAKLNVPAGEIDADAIAEKVASAVAAVQEPVSADYIASKVAEQIVIPAPDMKDAISELDVETLSRKVADKIALPASPEVDADRIAYTVVQRINEEKGEAQPAEVNAAIDEDALAENIAAKLNISLSDELIADAVVKNLAGVIDSDEVADCVAKKVGSVSPEEFDINVDDDGCDSLASAIEGKLDYDRIAAVLTEKLTPVVASAGEREIDAEELAKNVAEKLNVGAINEDALADKAAAVLSNYLPEIDAVDIADKVIAGIIPAIPAAPQVDSDAIATAVSEKLAEKQEDTDYDIVLDEEGIARLTESVAEGLKGEYAARFDKLDGDIDGVRQQTAEVGEKLDGTANEIRQEYNERFDRLENREVEDYGERFDKLEGDAQAAKDESNARFDLVDEELSDIKAMLASGAAVVAASELAAADSAVVEEAETVYEEPQAAEEEAPAEEEATEEAPAEEEELVTVSDLVDENGEAQPEEQAPAEEEEQLVTVSDLVDESGEAQPEEAAEDEEGEEAEAADVMDEIVDDIDESPVDDEVMPDGMPEDMAGGVDFANMMKYNRSFIARIIQGSDEQKNYYGKVKTALLSYKKVNSNIAWGAERFNKGRETIARFKIRGKTLCLYLALDPAEFATSVYHHVDVSDNKSMHGTPMMVKIKSPLGVKKAIRLIDEMLARRDGVKREIAERDYAAMYPYETMEELIEDGLVKDVSKK